MTAGWAVAEEQSAGTSPADGGSRHGLLVLVVATVLSLAAAAAGLPLAWLLAGLVATAVALGGGMRALPTLLPAASVLLVAATTAGPLVAGLVGADVLDGVAAHAVMALGAVLATAAAWWAGRETRLREPGLRGAGPRLETALVAAPAALLTALLGVVVAGGDARLSWFLSGDHLRHVGLTTRTVLAGNLEYERLSYPHGWHAVIAAMWGSTGAGRDGSGLRDLVEVQAAATWVLLVLVALSLAAVAATLARAAGVHGALVGVAGLVAGGLVLGPAFYGDYVPRGFDTTLLVLLVLAGAVQVAARAPESRAALVVAVAATFVTAHSWQVLLVPAGVIVALVLWRRRPWAGPRRDLLGDAAAVAVGAVGSLPGVVAAVSGFGVGAAAEAGDVPPPVLGWSVAVVAAFVVVLRRRDRGPATTAAAAVAATAFTSIGLAALAGVGLESYYPNKTLWVAVALGLPALGVVVALALAALDGPSVARRVGYVLVGTATALAVAVSAATPTLGVLRGTWGGARPAVVLGLVTSPDAPRAAVVWQAVGPVDDATAQLLLDFYTATATTPRLGLAATTAEEQCSLLRATARPTVISGAPEAELRARFACIPDLEVVRP
ncbi:hypothetical protein ACK8HX_14685 [Oryzobacter sp. R7]|uniref:hypothetical protein n=1 Tax=Oryzobacter faecalis TaxID=3388656 RepID=UPI00398D108D